MSRHREQTGEFSGKTFKVDAGSILVSFSAKSRCPSPDVKNLWTIIEQALDIHVLHLSYDDDHSITPSNETGAGWKVVQFGLSD